MRPRQRSQALARFPGRSAAHGSWKHRRGLIWSTDRFRPFSACILPQFLWPLIVTDTDRARTVTVGLASFTMSAESGAQWNLIAAGTVIVILPLLVLFILFQRRFVESFMYSGLQR